MPLQQKLTLRAVPPPGPPKARHPAQFSLQARSSPVSPSEKNLSPAMDAQSLIVLTEPRASRPIARMTAAKKQARGLVVIKAKKQRQL